MVWRVLMAGGTGPILLSAVMAVAMGVLVGWTITLLFPARVPTRADRRRRQRAGAVRPYRTVSEISLSSLR